MGSYQRETVLPFLATKDHEAEDKMITSIQLNWHKSVFKTETPICTRFVILAMRRDRNPPTVFNAVLDWNPSNSKSPLLPLPCHPIFP